jgi:hypothetical protein
MLTTPEEDNVSTTQLAPKQNITDTLFLTKEIKM